MPLGEGSLGRVCWLSRLALPQTEVCQHQCLPALAYVVGYLCLYGTSSCCRRFISFLLLCSFSTSQRPLPTRKGNLVY